MSSNAFAQCEREHNEAEEAREMDLTTPQAKEAFLTLAGDCRINEPGDWMAELGYNISEIEDEAA